MPLAEYATVLENLELDNDEVDLDEAFDPEEVPGHADGDYPTWLASRALDWFPEEVAAQFGSTGASILNGDIALAFIRDYPNPVAASRMTVDRMARFCRRHHYSGRVDPAVLLARMQPHLLAGSPGTTAGKQIMALHLVDQLEMLNQQERDFNVHLAAAVAAHPDGALFTSFPGIASVIAGVMIGELGDDRARFPAPGALLAESGLAPVTRASGRTRQVRFATPRTSTCATRSIGG